MRRRFRAALLMALMLVACSAPIAHEDAGGADDACVPRMCESVAADCGTIEDGCGGTLDCGLCGPEQICGLERPNACAGECTTDAHCPRGTFCDTARAACTADCRGPSTSAGIDITPVRVELDVTLGGSSLPVISGETSGPRLALLSRGLYQDLHSIALYERTADDTWAPRETIVLSLLPGEYDVIYAFDESSGGYAEHWPYAPFVTLLTVIVREEMTMRVDVPRVRGSIDVTLDGEVAPSSVTLDLIDHHTSAAMRLSAPLSERWLVPGTYALEYHGADAPWPQGRWSTSIAIEGDPIVVDVPSVNVSFEATLGGEPFTREGPIFMLTRGPDDWWPIGLPVSGGSVIPGTYELRVAGAPADAEWPASAATLDPALELATDRIVRIDIPRARVDVSVLLDGATMPPSDCGVASIGTWELGTSEQSAWLVPGRYPVAYRAPACDARIDDEWPMTSADLGEIVIAGADHVVVDVPRVRATITTTLAGGPMPAVASEWLAGSPQLELRPTARPDRVLDLPLYQAVTGGVVPRSAVSLWLSPGPHQLRYSGARGEFAGEWPAGYGVLAAALEVPEDGAIPIDILRVQVDVGVTLHGARVEVVRREDVWWGNYFGGIVGPEIALVPMNARDWWERVDLRLYPEDPSAPEPELVPVDRFTHWILPGTYAVRYQVSQSLRGAEPPIEWPFMSQDLGCWIVR